jgi:cytochrome c oxidase subunit 2
MEEFTYFHDFANLVLLFILISVSILMFTILTNTVIHKGLIEGHLLEFIWTFVPGLILIQLALPSLVLLYSLEDFVGAKCICLKAIGHQWYWSYNYPEYENLSSIDSTRFDSYIIPTAELSKGEFRLLDVDNRVTLPHFSPVRLLVTRADVLHAWAVPRLGVKTDAIPGRLNQINFESHFIGVFYGQCSEICGANHSFMPIVVQFTDFKDWVKTLR